MTQSQPARSAPDLTIVPGTRAAPVRRAIFIWLFGVAGLCLAIAVIGAITRLTESGLSMTEWKPLLQDIPPMSEAAWQRVFALYQASPQYQLVTHGMSLEDYKDIFWWEWFHRVLAQMIGVAFALPFVWFLVRRQLPRRLIPYLVGLFALGGVQGVLGWAMVASGLVDRPSVSHYRLAAHLSLDLTIYSLTLWTAFYVARPRAELTVPAKLWPALRRHAILGLALLAVTIVWGAFTAGLRAGLLYNTFPLMGGHIAPPDVLALDPWWSNLTENRAAVQFIHRVLAISTGLVLMALAYRLRADQVAQPLRRVATILFLDVAFQIVLGIETVLNQVPTWLGAVHQANAIILLGLVVRILFLLRKPYTPQARLKLVSAGS